MCNMKILFLTKSKEYTLRFLREIYKDGHDITVICKDYQSFKETDMFYFCQTKNIPYLDNKDMYIALKKGILQRYDIGISNNYGRLIKKDLIEWLNGNIINLHGAVLPKYKGAFVYNWGLYNLEKEWGVTAHFVNERFDEGDIIRIEMFAIDPKEISIKELERRTQEVAYYMALDIVRGYVNNTCIKGMPQDQDGRYYSREDFEKLKRIDSSDSIETINKKIHACWCPPYEGAYVEINGNRFCVINNEIMERINNA